MGMYTPASWFPGDATDSYRALTLTLSGPPLWSMPSTVAVRCHLPWLMPSAVADSVTPSVQTADPTKPQSTIPLTFGFHWHVISASTAAIQAHPGVIIGRHHGHLSAPEATLSPTSMPITGDNSAPSLNSHHVGGRVHPPAETNSPHHGKHERRQSSAHRRFRCATRPEICRASVGAFDRVRHEHRPCPPSPSSSQLASSSSLRACGGLVEARTRAASITSLLQRSSSLCRLWLPRIVTVYLSNHIESAEGSTKAEHRGRARPSIAAVQEPELSPCSVTALANRQAKVIMIVGPRTGTNHLWHKCKVRSAWS